jgi:ribosomal protein S18 acetylase RimI-like enzyme
MLSLDRAMEAELHAAMAANLSAHMSWVQSRLRGARVVDAPDLLLVDSGLACDTFNFVARARLAPERLEARVADALAFFAETGHPFSWWVGPGDGPEGLEEALGRAGLAAAEGELGMAAPLADLAPVDTSPNGLRVERARDAAQVADFAAVNAANWSPPDPDVLAFYEAAAPLLLGADSPLRLYVGYLGGRAVATAEACVAGGVVGLYNVATLESERRKGFGSALTVRPLLDAREEGVRTAVLQAAPDGQGVYARVGFRPSGRYTEFQPAKL